MIGEEIHEFCEQLWPLNRSITGDGVRETLRLVSNHCPDLVIHEVPTGTVAFDWVVPKEWRVREAWIEAPNGKRFCDFAENNLHLVGYSVPISQTMPLDELSKHLFSLPEQPNAIPYVTSYYRERWGSCTSQTALDSLLPGEYKVHIDSEFIDGSLT